MAISEKRPLVGSQKQLFIPVEDDVESCVQKRNILMKNLSTHISTGFECSILEKRK